MNKSQFELHLTFIIFSNCLILLFFFMPLEIVSATTANEDEAKNEQDVFELKIRINLNTINNHNQIF